MSKETKGKKSLKDKATGDFRKFNEETLQAIEDVENDRDMIECKDLEEFKNMLFADENDEKNDK
mgnify:CR=1 FL=1